MNQRAFDLADTLDRKTAQLEAALVIGGSDSFDDFSQEIKGNFLWLCSDLASEIRSDFDNFRNAVNRSATPEGGAK